MGDHDFKFRGDDVFLKSPEDDYTGLSTEDKLFIKLIDRSLAKDKDGIWTAPLL